MDYANPEALVTTEWLADHLSAPEVRIVDATYFLPTAGRDGRAEYAERHIPGARFFDIDDIADKDSALPHMIPDAQTFAAKVGALGIGSGHRVVAYDANGGAMAAARAWWMFRVFGHENAAVLSGGLGKWLAEGRPVTADAPEPLPADFEARMNPALVRTVDQLLANVESGAEQVADARSPERFAGQAPEPRPGARGGHIPGAVSLPYGAFMDADGDFAMRGADDIAAAIAAAGVTTDRPVVTTCGSGVTAGLLALGFHLVGRDDVAVYDGSWSEWGSRDDTPVET